MAEEKDSKQPGAAEGYNAAWAAVSYLIAGIGFWGFMGWLLARWLHFPIGIGLTIGMMLGTAGAIYLIVKRLGG